MARRARRTARRLHRDPATPPLPPATHRPSARPTRRSPLASQRYREKIDLEATLEAAGTKKLKRFTVRDSWKKSLEAAGQSGAFAHVATSGAVGEGGGAEEGAAGGDPMEEEGEGEESEGEAEAAPRKRARGAGGKAAGKSAAGGKGKGNQGKDRDDDDAEEGDEEGGEAAQAAEPKYKSLNKVLRNKGDPEAVRQARG